MKTILVATDLSERSDRAVARAIRLAAQHKCRLHFLHVVDDDLPERLAATMKAEAETHLERQCAAVLGENDSAEVVLGDPVAAIPEVARRLGADLVVLGLHRRRALLDRLRETTMERLVRRLRAPVLLVRNLADADYASVLVPVSFSPACAAALGAVRDLAPAARLAAFHAIHLPFAGLTGERPGGPMDRELREEAEAVCARWLAREAPPLAPEAVALVTGSLSEALARQIEETAPDLIALGAHTRSALASHALGSFAAEMVRDPPADILLAHP